MSRRYSIGDLEKGSYTISAKLYHEGDLVDEFTSDIDLSVEEEGYPFDITGEAFTITGNTIKDYIYDGLQSRGYPYMLQVFTGLVSMLCLLMIINLMLVKKRW